MFTNPQLIDSVKAEIEKQKNFVKGAIQLLQQTNFSANLLRAYHDHFLRLQNREIIKLQRMHNDYGLPYSVYLQGHRFFIILAEKPNISDPPLVSFESIKKEKGSYGKVGILIAGQIEQSTDGYKLFLTNVEGLKTFFPKTREIGGKKIGDILTKEEYDEFFKQYVPKFAIPFYGSRVSNSEKGPYRLKPNKTFMSIPYIWGISVFDYIEKFNLSLQELAYIFWYLVKDFEENFFNHGCFHNDMKIENAMIGVRYHEGKEILFAAHIDMDDFSGMGKEQKNFIFNPHNIAPQRLIQELPTIQTEIFSLGIIGAKLFFGGWFLNAYKLHCEGLWNNLILGRGDKKEWVGYILNHLKKNLDECRETWLKENKNASQLDIVHLGQIVELIKQMLNVDNNQPGFTSLAPILTTLHLIIGMHLSYPINSYSLFNMDDLNRLLAGSSLTALT